MNQDAKKAYQEGQVSALATLRLLEQALSMPPDAIGHRLHWGHVGSMVKASADLKELLAFVVNGRQGDSTP